jgi:broad specificity phosphatase PhoE
MHGAELEAELLGIREAANAAMEYVHARGANREERLLDLPNRVRDMVELVIHRGAAVALTVAHVCSGHVLHHLVGLLEGEELANQDGSREDFDEAADAVVDLVPAEGIMEEATGLLGP